MVRSQSFMTSGNDKLHLGSSFKGEECPTVCSHKSWLKGIQIEGKVSVLKIPKHI